MAESVQPSSTDAAYADRLVTLSGARWKRWVPNPYRWNIRHTCRGRVLDVGCGIGRTLGFLQGRGTGVDPNGAAILVAQAAGLDAHLPDELPADKRDFDTLLCSHVLEHVRAHERSELLRDWLPLLRPGGRVVLICPQERGFRSDPTHVEFLDGSDLVGLCQEVGLMSARVRSFPLPRPFGRWFIWNETVVVATVPAATSP